MGHSLSVANTAADYVEKAFSALAKRPGFVERVDQRQLAMWIADLIEGRATGICEAPTGLGKSLAALIPAAIHASLNNTRVIVATYTNVLAEQYWRKDLPLALALVGEIGLEPPRGQLLMGRGRYACLYAVEEHAPELRDALIRQAEVGHEADFRRIAAKPFRTASQLWQKVATPPVCPGRLCPAYDDCFYYRARTAAERASVVVTNHSVVIQDALLASFSDDGESMLGKFDFLILDEAHDFPSAAINGLEFELSQGRLSMLQGVAGRLENMMLPLAQKCGEGGAWLRLTTEFRDQMEQGKKSLIGYAMTIGKPGILDVAPPELLEHPQVQAARSPQAAEGAEEIAAEVRSACQALVDGLKDLLPGWREQEPDRARIAYDSAQNYIGYVREYGIHCDLLVHPVRPSVSYVGGSATEALIRQDVVDLAEPLRELIWNRTPWICLSATLAVDGAFDFFKRTTGAEPMFEEMLPSPFDFGSQAALYLPPLGALPDPTLARREGFEDAYHRALANEIGHILRVCDGRTLALFHSRREMEAVMSYLDVPPELPVFMQPKSGASTVGERFLSETHASMFALRSFWTGFDAPGETCSCVVLVRVPFEVPTDPPQIARLARLQQLGLDPFSEHTLPVAKMLMRQGAGRLIRRAEDKGIIALLDVRLQTKRYGEQILANLPPEMRTFREIEEAAAWIGLQSRTLM